MTQLAAEQLGFAYGDGPTVLEDVSLTLAPGDLTCVLGPNGAGKSTLLKLMAGLLPAARGRVSVDGETIATLSARDRSQRVGVVPQWLARIPDVRVDDFVLGGRYGHLDRWRNAAPADHAAVRAALASANVADLAERGFPTLSGGQRRRVLVARALAQEAGFLLVDEPTSELDPEHQLSIFALLRELAEGGRGILVVTHDLNLASQYATRVLLLANGRHVASGSPPEVLQAGRLRSVYSAPFRTGTWPTARGPERPFHVPWDGPDPDPARDP